MAILENVKQLGLGSHSPWAYVAAITGLVPAPLLRPLQRSIADPSPDVSQCPTTKNTVN